MKGLVVTALICAAVIDGALALGQVNQSQIEKTQQEAYINADVIEVRHREHNGKRQYRRYNVTKGRWVDNQWIDLPSK